VAAKAIITAEIARCGNKPPHILIRHINEDRHSGKSADLIEPRCMLDILRCKHAGVTTQRCLAPSH